MKFFTKTEKEEMFMDIVKFAATTDNAMALGVYINTLFDEKDIRDKWKAYKQTYTKDEQEVIDVLSKGWKIYSLDGVIWYNENDVYTKGPFARLRDPRLRIISTTIWNKCKEKNLIPNDFKFDKA